METPRKSPRRVDPTRPNPESPRPVHPHPLSGKEGPHPPEPKPPEPKPPEPFPGPPKPLDPNPYMGGRRFWVELDWSVGLSDEAVRRVGKQLRRAVFEELGQLDDVSELVIREIDQGGSRGLQIWQTRG